MEVHKGVIEKTGSLGFTGPAGTGKTSTFKDIAWYTGVSMVVFSCSAEMAAKTIANYLKPIDASHAVCFDEFTRLLPQTMGDIISAKLFDKSFLKADSRFYMTWNAGYAGRTDLPAEL